MAAMHDRLVEALKDAIRKCYRCEGTGVDKMRSRVVAWGQDKGKEFTPECLHCAPQRDALEEFEAILKEKRNNDTVGATDV